MPARAPDDAAGASLTGGGQSLVGVGGAMRARDVSRPRDADVAAAETLVEVSFRPRFRPRPAEGQADGSAGGSPDAS